MSIPHNTYTVPLSLYVHIPWCLHKCPYCDFNSHAMRGTLPEQAYITALIDDFKSQSILIHNRNIQSIFIGGGTPSLLSSDAYHRLLNELHRLHPIADDAEITLEANPSTLEQSRFQAYRRIGINRLSIGIQSFQDEKLAILQRTHNALEATTAVAIAQAAGFDNLNLDLMFGLPDQTLEEGLSDLRAATALQPTHLSWYQFTLEPHTYFYQHPPPLPGEEAIGQLQQAGEDLLAHCGLQKYEVSAYAQAGKQCQHNRNYWAFGDYIGIGAGAHGKITDIDHQRIMRYWNQKHPKAYLNYQQHPSHSQRLVTPAERPLEFMMNALRLQEAIPLAWFTERTGLTIHTIQEALNTAQQQKLLHWDHRSIRLTTRGHRYLNEILTLF